jgi:hypothetical protein
VEPIRMANKKVPIKYTSRDFNSIKADLVDHAKRYYPNTVKDFNESSFGSLMFDSVSYVGDILSFYLDYNVNESFLTTALERKNVLKLARQMGFKIPAKAVSYGTIQLYVLIPANSLGTGPDTAYTPIIEKGTTVKSNGGQQYILTEDVDFSDPNNPIVVARVSATTGLPTSYAIKASGIVMSGKFKEQIFTIGEFEKFKKIPLNSTNITEVLSAIDNEGHEYYEVDYLSQDVIYKEIKNTDSTTVTSLLKPFPVPRRFILERTIDNTYIQFGFGSEDQITSDTVVDPSQVVLSLQTKTYVTDTSFDPTNIVKTDKLGVGPSNTTLRVKYLENDSLTSNSPAANVKTVSSLKIRFRDRLSLSNTVVSEVANSVEVNNEEPIVGEVSELETDEIKIKTLDFYASQNRAVSKQDYIALTYAMPNKFGAVKRCNIIQDSNSFKRNLNMYVISENSAGNLVQTNTVIKQNLKNWLNNNRMVNDTIDILDAKIVNIGINFSVISTTDSDKYDVLQSCYLALIAKYNIKFEISEPFSISDIYTTLNKLDGVSDVVNVEIVNKTGAPYSTTRLDIQSQTSPDGRYINVPSNVILEILDSASDIKGTIR